MIKVGRGINVDVKGKSWTDVPISFGKTFSAQPYVVATLTGISENINRAYLQCIVGEVTTTGCVLRIYNASDITFGIGYTWMASKWN